MDIDTKNKIISTTKDVVLHLVNQKYQEIEKKSSGVRLTADEISRGISDYNSELIMPPEADFEDSMDVIEIMNSNPRAWSVRYNLWTKEEGRSDLTIELTLIDNEGNNWIVEVDNIHVL